MRNWNELSMAEKADVMKLAIEGGVYDLDAIRSGYNEYAKGGSIHIKPENRGKFTALKKRTGHSATWFKEHGTPAQKKMAVFALNAAKWKHEDGGNLYEGDNPNGQKMKIGALYYDYNVPGNPLTRNIIFPEVEIIGTNRNYPLKAKQERDRQKEIAKTYFSSTPTPSNIYRGIEALYNSSPLVTTAATVNPNMVYGIAPTDATFAGSPLNSTTSNLLKWLGKPLDQKHAKSALAYLKDSGNPDYQRLAYMLQEKGVDLSRIDFNDMKSIFSKRWDELFRSSPDRFTIVKPVGPKDYSMADFVKGRETAVGETQLAMDDNGVARMEDIMNYTRNSENPIKEVQERGLNSAIQVSNSVGGDGVITGEIYLSAPKQYHVAQKFRNREVVGHNGQHSNFNMVRDHAKKTGFWDDGSEYPASSLLDMARAGNTKRKFLDNAPVWKLKKPTYQVPTKSLLFDPTKIDNEGRMIIDWADPSIFSIGGFLKR